MALITLTTTPYERRHRQAVLDMLFRSFHVHTHLDWHEASEWLDTQDALIRLAWEDQRLTGMMATSIPLNATCWIRVAAVQDWLPPQGVLETLWASIRAELRARGVQSVSILIINDWLLNYVGALGFRYEELVVTLQRSGRTLPTPRPPTVATTIRAAELQELKTIADIDQAAFPPPWQMTLNDLRQAHRISASCTVALVDGAIAGYQLSTLFRDSAHLARLAVLPALQDRGIGAALLDDLIRRFLRRGIQSMTVNTQKDNFRSQHLYRRYNFARNGYDLPVWQTHL
jgi:GNAT superfamily N-acetyltransferase